MTIMCKEFNTIISLVDIDLEIEIEENDIVSLIENLILQQVYEKRDPLEVLQIIFMFIMQSCLPTTIYVQNLSFLVS